MIKAFCAHKGVRANICSTAQASAGLEVEVLECKGVDGLEEQDEADEHKHRVADEIMLIAVLHLCVCSRHKLKAHDKQSNVIRVWAELSH